MNMSFLTVQEKSEDSRFPMNGKISMITNVHSIGLADGILFVNYEDKEYQMNEIQFKLDNISHFFVS